MSSLRTKIMALFHLENAFVGIPLEHRSVDKITRQALVLQNEGADIIHIGGVEGASATVHEEREYTLPVLWALKKATRVPISIDVKYVEVAKEALALGVDVINDLSGFRDELMREIVAKSDVDVCLTHRPRRLTEAHGGSHFETGAIAASIDWLDKQTRLLLHDGVELHRIIIDPGIGFGKTLEENFEILRHIQKYRELEFRVSVEIPHKALFPNFSDTNQIISATIALNTFLALSNVDIIRVHNVLIHREALNLLEAVRC